MTRANVEQHNYTLLASLLVALNVLTATLAIGYAVRLLSSSDVNFGSLALPILVGAVVAGELPVLVAAVYLLKTRSRLALIINSFGLVWQMVIYHGVLSPQVAELGLRGLMNPDYSVPTVVIREPSVASGAVVHGSEIRVEIDAVDNTRLAKVELFIDGVVVNTFGSLPYAYEWDTASISKGRHEIEARAIDGVGNEASSKRFVEVK